MEEKRCDCPICGAEAYYTKYDDPRIAWDHHVVCPHCGFEGDWSIDFGWGNTNTPL